MGWVSVEILGLLLRNEERVAVGSDFASFGLNLLLGMDRLGNGRTSRAKQASLSRNAQESLAASPELELGPAEIIDETLIKTVPHSDNCGIFIHHDRESRGV